jgi:hypothetical protein
MAHLFVVLGLVNLGDISVMPRCCSALRGDIGITVLLDLGRRYNVEGDVDVPAFLIVGLLVKDEEHKR